MAPEAASKTSEAATGAGRAADGLSFAARGAILGIAVLIFAFATGPIWEHPYDIDMAVLLSYLAIPVMVGVTLAALHRWSIRAAVLESAILLTTKFGITYVVTALMWSISGPPPAVVRPPPPPEEPRAAVPPPVPTTFAADQLGQLQGRVTNPQGAPLPGALVYVASGLEGAVFKAPTSPVLLQNDGTGFAPALQGVQVGQPIIARSTDSKLHTVRVYRGNAVLLNVPAITRQAEHRFSFDQAHGETRVVCGVHEATGAEQAARLVVLSNPFFALTGADGTFRFEGVPAGKTVEVRALGASGCSGTQSIAVAGLGGSPVSLVCGEPLLREPTP